MKSKNKQKKYGKKNLPKEIKESASYFKDLKKSQPKEYGVKIK